MPSVIFKTSNKIKRVKVKENASILEVARNENIEIEGSCEGSMACSTCHVIVPSKWYKKLEPPALEELEMLELLPNYNKYSRLGCQIKITKNLNGITINLPE